MLTEINSSSSSTSNTYDCTPRPAPEKITHHVARVVHNIFHPHHKHFFIPLALTCHAPEMETVTVTADAPSISFPSDKLTDPHGDYYGSGYTNYGGYPVFYGGGGYYVGGGGGCVDCDHNILVHTPPDNPPPRVSVPEPGSFALMIPAIIMMLIVQKIRGRISSH